MKYIVVSKSTKPFKLLTFYTLFQDFTTHEDPLTWLIHVIVSQLLRSMIMASITGFLVKTRIFTDCHHVAGIMLSVANKQKRLHMTILKENRHIGLYRFSLFGFLVRKGPQ